MLKLWGAIWASEPSCSHVPLLQFWATSAIRFLQGRDEHEYPGTDDNIMHNDEHPHIATEHRNMRRYTFCSLPNEATIAIPARILSCYTAY
jgi:hypothetical protein